MNGDEQLLWNLTLAAHRASVFRDNISTSVLKATFEGSWNVSAAIAAAILSFGGSHGPVEATMELLASGHPDVVAHEMLMSDLKVPGWGSSFALHEWQPVDDLIAEKWSILYRKIEAVTRVLNDHGKDIGPNPSCWTASMNLILDIPKHLALWPVIQGRLSGWMEVLK